MGRSLYIEGSDFGSHNAGDTLYDMFGCNYVSDGAPYFQGNCQVLSGQNGTITNGMNFNYLYQEPPDHCVDVISANGGTVIFKSQDGLSRAIVFSGSGNNYRAIHSTGTFGAFRNGAASRNDLMGVYLNYLLGN